MGDDPLLNQLPGPDCSAYVLDPKAEIDLTIDKLLRRKSGDGAGYRTGKDTEALEVIREVFLKKDQMVSSWKVFCFIWKRTRPEVPFVPSSSY